ncbi:CDP-glycerol glycerophosphotransferase family protein [Enterococcus hirae]|uniref:CDP-glycerol glycerophosphotransferase family protein n=1 Tax=Enterococcus hirae TaxID=1354 RepID=UPI001D9F676D|nr:CDP-glycerol glycerophosphotransferase family protein [Enterococcus hirae]MBS6191842.1 CDP-glycerol glycerophosphotransferase family protein [Enterococcus hirae]
MRKKFVFCSVPDFSDNARAMFEFMVEYPIEGEYIWLFNDSEQTRDPFFDKYKEKKVKFIQKNSFIGMYHYLTATFSFSDHGIFNNVPKVFSPKKIELWHGMPLKQIGNYHEKNTIFFDKTISTSPIFDEVLSKAFGITNHELIYSGLPRNDKLFIKNSYNISQLFFQNDYPVIAWLPTFRKHISGDYNDGSFENNKLAFFDFDELKELDQQLMQSKKNLLVKLHPLDILNREKELDGSFKQIRILTTNQFEKQHFDLYKILSEVEGLITDYSSVYFDFLLTKKPIGLVQTDVEEYKKTRGIIKKIEQKMIGSQIKSKEDFVQFLIEEKRHELNYDELITIFQERDTQGKNARSICTYLQLIKEDKKSQ